MTREERLALNEARFRELNEQLVRSERMWGQVDGTVLIICECADANCSEPLSLPPAAYERARAHAEHFLVLPDHVRPEMEDVILMSERYALVAKRGEAAEVAEETDPRSPDT